MCSGELPSFAPFLFKSTNIFCRNLDETALTNLRLLVDTRRYTVYSLLNNDWIRDVWQGSTNILIISNESAPEDQKVEIAKVNNYLSEYNGKVLLILSSDCKHVPDIHSISKSLEASEGFSHRTNGWVWKTVNGLLCLLNEKQLPIMVIIQSNCNEVISKALALLGILCSLTVGENHFPSSTTLYTTSPSTSSYTDIFECLVKVLSDATTAKVKVVPQHEKLGGFSFADYFAALGSTHRLGRYPFWTEVLPSTFSLCHRILPKLPACSGLMVASAEQTAGIGRGSNQWISPRGMACFTVHLDLPLSSESQSCDLRHLLSWVQHLASLAVLLALRELVDQSASNRLPSTEIRIKWPNDVYAIDKNTHISSKIAGILTNVSCSSLNSAQCLVGIGINVANSRPTICLHDLIRSGSEGSNMMLPTVGVVIGRTLNYLENLILRFETGGPEEVKDLYTSCWVHTGQRIRALEDDCPNFYTIIGVDEYGYLRVVNGRGEESVLSPDGNSIDMLVGNVISRGAS